MSTLAKLQGHIRIAEDLDAEAQAREARLKAECAATAEAALQFVASQKTSAQLESIPLLQSQGSGAPTILVNITAPSRTCEHPQKVVAVHRCSVMFDFKELELSHPWTITAQTTTVACSFLPLAY